METCEALWKGGCLSVPSVVFLGHLESSSPVMEDVGRLFGNLNTVVRYKKTIRDEAIYGFKSIDIL
jgi:hypothetical protein